MYKRHLALLSQPWMMETATQRVLEILQQGTQEVRFVGGCVRDALKGYVVQDVDIATPLHPEEVCRRFEREGISLVLVGYAHGTVIVAVEGRTFEITTLRCDVVTDGRHAQVKFIDDWIQDAARRDFTINALSCTPDGTLYDPFGGIQDLHDGRIRFVGDPEARLREDLLRLLRFFRFHASYGRGAPDSETLSLCRRFAPCLQRLSAERIYRELLRLLQTPMCAEVWLVMLVWQIITWILPMATSVWCLRSLLEYESLVCYKSPDSALRRLSALLLADPQKAVKTVPQNLRFSKNERKYLTSMLTLVSQKESLYPEKNLKVTLAQIAQSALLCDTILVAVAAGLVPTNILEDVDHIMGLWQQNRFPLSGKDVVQAGVRPGPLVGFFLKSVTQWWSEQDFRPSRRACLEVLHRITQQKDILLL